MSKMITITIDGRKITAPEGERLLWVALQNGIYIQPLCNQRKQPAFRQLPPLLCRSRGFCGSCNILHPACKGRNGGKTRSPRVDRLVQTAFELLLSHHRLECSSCPGNGSCELQRIAKERRLKLRVKRYKPLEYGTEIDDSPKTFVFDRSKCVLCGRCVWICHNIAKVGALGFSRRGLRRAVTTFGDIPLADSPCTECGLCVEACPVSALY